MKIAKIVVGNPSNRKGYFNSVIDRTKNLAEKHSNVDCYMLRFEHYPIINLIRRKKPLKSNREEYTTVDGIRFKNIWMSYGIIDYLLTYRLNLKLTVSKKKHLKNINYFKEYDLISTHGIEANYLGSVVKSIYGVAHVTNWHGSDINIRPFKSVNIRKMVKKILDYADHNFFVSNKLMETAALISSANNKSVLYTGPSDKFKSFNSEIKEKALNSLGVRTKYTVGFVGNLIPIKNVLTLPKIFSIVQSKIDSVTFIIVGDGSLERQLVQDLDESRIMNLIFLGKQEPEHIPKIMNCLNILVLPSLNEGLPLVILEALACGAHVVGSNKGGIPEIIGADNSFDLRDNFEERIANRIVTLLKNTNISFSGLPHIFSNEEAVKEELMIYEKIYELSKTSKDNRKDVF